jgi:hypothetical protein
MKTSFFRRRLLPIVLFGCFFASVGSAQVTVSISFAAGELDDADGNPLPDGRLAVLVADTAGDGFGGVTFGSALSVGSFLNADDQILLAAFIDSGSFGDGGVAHSLTPIDLSDAPFTSVSPGESLALIWFSTLDGSSLNVPADAEYGEFSGGLTPLSGSPWIVPSAGGAGTLEFLTTAADGDYDDTLARANLTAVSAVPEPASCAALAGLCALALGFIRRRRVGHRG